MEQREGFNRYGGFNRYISINMVGLIGHTFHQPPHLFILQVEQGHSLDLGDRVCGGRGG
jgi:hypothetical protein